MSLEFLANILFPPICVACRSRISSGVVCETCFAGIAIRDSLVFKDSNFPYTLGAAGYYEDKVLQSLIHHLKFRSIQGAAEPLAELMARYAMEVVVPANSTNGDLSESDFSGFIVIPIPLSRRRFCLRGYNQAELIARRFAKKLKERSEREGKSIYLPIANDILIRTKNTKPQSETVSEAERRANLSGAFTIADSPIARKIFRGPTGDGPNIILIDDVCTTGSTFLEASLSLKAAGAKTIVALAAAKT